jgi:hypothetical protein
LSGPISKFSNSFLRKATTGGQGYILLEPSKTIAISMGPPQAGKTVAMYNSNYKGMLNMIYSRTSFILLIKGENNTEFLF